MSRITTFSNNTSLLCQGPLPSEIPTIKSMSALGGSWIPCIVSNIAIQVSGGMGYDELTLSKARHLQRNLLAKEVLLERGLWKLIALN